MRSTVVLLYTAAPGLEPTSHTSVELHQTGTFEGPSIDSATAPKQELVVSRGVGIFEKHQIVRLVGFCKIVNFFLRDKEVLKKEKLWSTFFAKSHQK